MAWENASMVCVDVVIFGRISRKLTTCFLGLLQGTPGPPGPAGLQGEKVSPALRWKVAPDSGQAGARAAHLNKSGPPGAGVGGGSSGNQVCTEVVSWAAGSQLTRDFWYLHFSLLSGIKIHLINKTLLYYIQPY